MHGKCTQEAQLCRAQQTWVTAEGMTHDVSNQLQSAIVNRRLFVSAADVLDMTVVLCCLVFKYLIT